MNFDSHFIQEISVFVDSQPIREEGVYMEPKSYQVSQDCL